MVSLRAMIVGAFALFLAASAAVAEDAAAAAAAGATGTDGGEVTPTLEQRQKCEACHLVMDSFYMQLMSLFLKKRKTTRGVVELKGDEMAMNVCKEMIKTPGLYGPTAERMCEAFLAEHRTALLQVFSTNFEINDNVDNFYHLKRGLCEKVHAGCMRPQDKPKVDACDSCKLLMEDTERVFSWGLGRKNFASKEHIYRVMEDLCLNLLVRHPVRYHHQLLETCGELTDDYSAAIVAAIQSSLSTKGPAPARKICIEKTKLCPKEEL